MTIGQRNAVNLIQRQLISQLMHFFGIHNPNLFLGRRKECWNRSKVCKAMKELIARMEEWHEIFQF